MTQAKDGPPSMGGQGSGTALQTGIHVTNATREEPQTDSAYGRVSQTSAIRMSPRYSDIRHTPPPNNAMSKANIISVICM